MRLAALTFMLFAMTAVSHAGQDTLDHLYSPELAEKHQYLLDRVLSHARNTEYDYALALSESLLEQLDDLRTELPSTYGQLMINQGIILSAGEDYELGLSHIDRGLAFMAQQTNPFSRKLISGIMAKAITELYLDQYKAAEDSFRRAQHITHRQGGVYAEDQISMVSYLTTAFLKQKDPLAADQQQLFSLRIAENVHGRDSLELLPVLDRLGGYFATRGSAIPAMVTTDIRLERDNLFKTSVQMYQRSVTIIEKNFGENDLRLVQPLRGLASARMLQITNRKYAEAALERSLEIVQSNPQSDTTDRAQALIDLGDLYVITSDRRATNIYLEAWQMLQERSETIELTNALFGTPTRLFPREDRMLYLDRQPDAVEPGTPLFVSLEYNVTPQGTVSRVKVIDRNVPNEQVRALRQKIRSSKFRPRIVDGEILTTEGLTLYQPFKVFRRSTGIVQPASTPTDTPSEQAPDSALADDEGP